MQEEKLRFLLPLLIPESLWIMFMLEGITRITAKDIRYAKEMGCEIKLLGVARRQEDGAGGLCMPDADSGRTSAFRSVRTLFLYAVMQLEIPCSRRSAG